MTLPTTEVPPLRCGQSPAEPGSTPRRAWIKPLLLVILLVTALVAARTFGIGERLEGLRTWVIALGPWGPVVFIAVYAVAVLAAVPGSFLTVAAGTMFGSFLGVGVVSVGSTLGAALAFAAARWMARDSVTRWTAESERFTRLDIMTRDHGAVVVAITRLVPIFPFTLLNYGFGLTSVPFSTYVFWSWLCMLPGTVLYVVGADAVAKTLAEGQVPWVLIGIVIVVAVGLFFLVRRARRSLEPARTQV